MLIAFLLHQWLHERASTLSYAYIPVLLLLLLLLTLVFVRFPVFFRVNSLWKYTFEVLIK